MTFFIISSFSSSKKRVTSRIDRSGGQDAAGIGQGMLQGQLANLIALVKIVAPPIYLQVYKVGAARGIPAAPFFLYSGYFLFNALLLFTVPKDQL